MIPVNVIVAVDKEFGIGKQGGLPWHIPNDLKHFKEVTTASDPAKKNVVIMGRVTWESLPEKFKPLPGRLNLVLTRKKDYVFPDGVLSAPSYEGALEMLEKDWGERIASVFVIGGAQIYKQALAAGNVENLYITRLLQLFDCDTFFPLTEETLSKEFERVEFSTVSNQHNITFYFTKYKKIKNKGRQ